MDSDSKNLNNGGTETEQSSLPKDEQSNTQSLPSSLVREASSIYSLTLDEFQQTLFDNGKNLGSMNMDEFLNICIEENNNDSLVQSNNKSSPSNQQNPPTETKIIPITQQNLTRQDSLTLPCPLFMKTVEEVWSEMNRDQQQFNELKISGKPHRQSTFGEMTLEDFLVKAGVVRERCDGSSSSQSQMQNLQSYYHLETVQTQQSYPIYPRNNSNIDPKFGITGLGFSDSVVSGNGIPTIPQGGFNVGDSKESDCQRGRWSGTGSGGYNAGQTYGPVSASGMCTSQVFNSMSQFEVDVNGGKRGRKRASESPIEKVVERKQRRMIKNREAATRSRARKQAYTVELEEALDKLKEENARLYQTLLQDTKKEKHSKRNVPRISEKMKMLRRMWSLPLPEF